VFNAFPTNETGEVICYYQNGNEGIRFNLGNGMRQGLLTLSFENGQEHIIVELNESLD
jgi:hypothetical protein